MNWSALRLNGYPADRALATASHSESGDAWDVRPRNSPASMTQVVWADKHCEDLVTGSMEVRVPISPASAALRKVRLGSYVVGTLSRIGVCEADFAMASAERQHACAPICM